MFVAGSRPIVVTWISEPPGATASNSPRRGRDCSEAMSTSGPQTVAERYQPSPTLRATTELVTVAVRATSSFERSDRMSVRGAMLFSRWMGGRVRISTGEAHQPDGRYDIRHCKHKGPACAGPLLVHSLVFRRYGVM